MGWGKCAETQSPGIKGDRGYGEGQELADTQRKRRHGNRESGRVRGGDREPEAENDAEREAHGMETTQIDRWGRKEPWGETQQTVTHSRGVEEMTRRPKGPVRSQAGGQLVLGMNM